MADQRATGGLEEKRAYKTAVVNASSSGDNEIVAAVTSKRIKVYAISINFAGTVSAKWRSATTDLSAAQPFQEREGYVLNVTPPSLLLQTAAGEALNLNLNAAIAATGWVAYWDDDAA